MDLLDLAHLLEGARLLFHAANNLVLILKSFKILFTFSLVLHN